MKSPFKFLDAFELRDRDVFFGRDEETEQLYQMVNKNRLVLVYGQSGIGKTSLIQCGLAGRYDSTDWLPIFVRRGDDFNQSFSAAIKKILPDVIIPEIIGPDEIEAAFNKFLRPIYLIFDQLEELFILGSPEEQQKFIESICALHENDLPCRILFVIREEYLGALYDFEKIIPTLFDRRLRVEPMNASKVTDVLQQSFSRFNIQLVSPSHNIKQIIENVSDKRAGV
jgi:AAA+ ATPase superfamily predicted ATPase